MTNRAGLIEKHHVRRLRPGTLRAGPLAASIGVGLRLLAGWLLFAAPAGAADAPKDAANAVPTTLRYETHFTGKEPGDLRKLLTASSDLVQLQSKPPLSIVGLRQRAESDSKRLRQVLESQGYYAGRIEILIHTERTPVQVTILADPGPAYILNEFAISWTGCAPSCPPPPPSSKELGAPLGQRAVASDVVQAEQKLLSELHNHGRPFARVADRRAVVDHARHIMTVSETFDPGPEARYGPLVFRGKSNVKTRYIERLVPWKPGDPYSQAQVEDFQHTLAGTGLFRTAVVEPASNRPRPDGTLPIQVTLAPAKEHSVGVGAYYSTSEGPGGKVFWEDRNLLGGGETLRITGSGDRLGRSLTFDASKPNFLRRDQTLKGQFIIEDVTTDAYNERGIESQVGLERKFSKLWTGSAGLSLTAANIEDKNIGDRRGKRPVFLVGLPLGLKEDATDNLLDPRKGTRLNLTVTPEGGTVDGKGVQFVRNEAVGSAYYTFGSIPALTLAGRARLGSIVGVQRSSLPANRRFYAGGGGSVRGYKYQRVGPLGDDHDPIGGRSVVEVSGELRTRITQTLGFVPFVDGGQVYSSSYPTFSDGMQWAAGIGFRYFSAIGPIRLDIAFPLNPRKDVDKLLQVYISIGQAF